MWISSSSRASKKVKVVSKVKQWITNVDEEKACSDVPLCTPSGSLMFSTPLLTILSHTSQSTRATSIKDEDCCMDDEEVHYGRVGDNGDNTLECEEHLNATKDMPVSCMPWKLALQVASQFSAAYCGGHPTATTPGVGGKADCTKAKESWHWHDWDHRGTIPLRQRDGTRWDNKGEWWRSAVS